MPRKGVTGHDDWVVVEALATAYVALEQLPEKHQPRAHMDDIKKLLASGRQPDAVSLPTVVGGATALPGVSVAAASDTNTDLVAPPCSMVRSTLSPGRRRRTSPIS